MKILNFTLMPYRPMDIPASKQHRSAWVVLPNTFYDPELGAQEYESYIDMLAESETLGFDGVCVNEHHQTAYGLMPAPNLIASALIQRTKRAKLSIVGSLVPLLNPIRGAEEYAMLDVMSGGRLIAGLMRGIPHEYVAYNIPPAESWSRQKEATQLIIRAWTEPEPFGWEGEHFQFRQVSIWPRPLQKPHPPLWFGGFGEATYRRVAELGSGYYGFDQTPAEIAAVRERLGELLAERGRSLGEITISHGVYNRLPVSTDTLAEYHAAGVDQFVVSLRAADQDGMRAELEWFGREFIGRC